MLFPNFKGSNLKNNKKLHKFNKKLISLLSYVQLPVILSVVVWHIMWLKIQQHFIQELFTTMI